jgi:hypothetical protein
MKRRAVLVGLAGAAAGRLRADPAPARETWIAWGGGACWIVGASVAPQRLPVSLAEAVAPVVAAHGLWIATREASVQRWQRGEPGTLWHCVFTHALPAPPHLLAASDDGRWAAAAHGERLSLIDRLGADGTERLGTDLAQRRRATARALIALPHRRSVLAAWPALGEWWELSLDPAAAPVFDGLVHDYRMGEAIAARGYLTPRRFPLAPAGASLPMPAFAARGAAWVGAMQGDQLVVIHLDVRRSIAAWALPGARPDASALPTPTRWWVPVKDEVHGFDTARWQPLFRARLPGPGLALHTMRGAVWALVGSAGAATLWRCEDEAARDWQRVEDAGRDIVACAADAAGQRMAVLHAEPPGIQVFDLLGRVQHAQRLPGDPAPRRLAAFQPG